MDTTFFSFQWYFTYLQFNNAFVLPNTIFWAVHRYLPLWGLGMVAVLHGGPLGAWISSGELLSGLGWGLSSFSLSEWGWNGRCPKLSLISRVRSLAASAASLCCCPSAKAKGLVPKLALILVFYQHSMEFLVISEQNHQDFNSNHWNTQYC